MFTPPKTGLPLGTGGVSSWMETRRGDREAVSVLSFQVNKPGSICWVLTSPFHTFFFSVHLTNVTVHQSLIVLSESLEKTNKLKSSFTKHSRWTLLTQYWTWANIRLINSTQHALKVTGFSWSSVRRRFLHENLFNNLISNILITYQFSSVAQSCLTLCDPMNWSTPGLHVHHQLPELTQTHVHWVGDAIQPSHPLSSPSPPALNLSQHHGLFKWVSSLHQVAKVLEFQLQHQTYQWTPRTDLL